MYRQSLLVKKHACGGFFVYTVCPGACGSPGGKQESLAAQGFRICRTCRQIRMNNQRAAALRRVIM